MQQVDHRKGAHRAGLAACLTAVVALAIPLAAQAAPTLSIKAGHRLIPYKRSVTISGRLSSGRRGVTVALRADRFPFDGFKRRATTTTDKDGRYRFRARPSLGTRYQAAAATDPPVRSATRTVYVAPSATDFVCSPCGANSAPASGSVTYHESFTVHFPRSLDLASQPLYFYWGQRNGSQTEPPAEVKRVKTVKGKLVRPGEMKVKITYKFTAPGREYNYVSRRCGRDHFAKDGSGLPGHHRCGDKTIEYPAYNRYLG